MGDKRSGSEHSLLLLIVYNLIESNYLHTIRKKDEDKEGIDGDG
jgi:hypothetical protein